MNDLHISKIQNSFIKTTKEYFEGVTCLGSIINYYGGETTVTKLVKNTGSSIEGISIKGLCNAARIEGFDVNACRGNIEFLKELKRPIILYVLKDTGKRSFIVLYGWHNNKFIIGDPILGIIEFREDELDNVWNSKAFIHLEPIKTFITKKEKDNIIHEWFRNSIKKQNKYFLIISVLSIVSAILCIIIFSLILYNLELFNLPNPKKGILFGISWTLLSILMLILINYFKQKTLKRGIIEYVSWIHKYIVEKLVVFNNDENKISARTITALIKATEHFGSFLFQRFSKIPLFGSLLVISIIFITSISKVSGIILLTNLLCFCAFSWIFRKKLGSILIQSFMIESKTIELQNEDFKRVNLLGYEKEAVKNISNGLLNALNVSQKLKQEKNKYGIFLITCTFLSIICICIIYLIKLKEYGYNLLYLFCWILIYILSIAQIKDVILDYICSRASFDFLKSILNKVKFSSIEKSNKAVNHIINQVNNISIENLALSFPGKSPILNNINFSAKKGDFTLVYGTTGKGKSLLVSVLTRFIPLEIGKITINGMDWNEIDDVQMRSLISLVCQPVSLFNNTVIKNVGWGPNTYEPEKIVDFCKEWGFDRFISRFSNDYTTVICKTEGISGGQMQLIAIASAIYRKSQILILDEPLANMDEEMKLFCLNLFKKIKANLPILVFSGDIALKAEADKVFYI